MIKRVETWIYQVQAEVTIDGRFIDHNNHLNNLGSLKLFEEERHRISVSLGLPPLLREMGISIVVKRTEADYNGPVFRGDKVMFDSRFNWGQASLIANQAILKEGKAAVEAIIRLALIDGTGRPQKVPDFIKNAYSPRNLE